MLVIASVLAYIWVGHVVKYEYMKQSMLVCTCHSIIPDAMLHVNCRCYGYSISNIAHLRAQCSIAYIYSSNVVSNKKAVL